MIGNFARSQLAPNGKIYCAANSSFDYLHVIDYPDRPGKSCQFRQHGIKLPTINLGTIPNNPNYRLGPLDGSPGDTLGLDNLPAAYFRADTALGSRTVQFIDLSVYEPAGWRWFFGDGGTSSEREPLHTFPKFGVFNVCLVVENAFGVDTFCRDVVVVPTVGTGQAADSEVLVSLFPNPADGQIFLELEEISQPSLLQISDVFGKIVLTEKLERGKNTWTTSTKNFSSGVYFLNFQSSSGQSAVLKFVVSH